MYVEVKEIDTINVSMIDACNKVVDKGWLYIYVIRFMNLFIKFFIDGVSFKNNKINMTIPIIVNVTFTPEFFSSPNSSSWRKNTMTNEIHIIK